MNRRNWLALALLGGPLSQAPAQTMLSDAHQGPWAGRPDGADPRLMLGGHDPVAYFDGAAPLRGDTAWSLDWGGATWRFASEANRARFRATPWAFGPQFGGFCAQGLQYALPWEGDGGPDTWRLYRGRLYVFASPAARDHFELDTELGLARAKAYWHNEVAGSDVFMQRARRLVFRVPHFRTERSLAQEWAARRDAGTLPVMPGAAQAVPPR